MTHLFPSLSQMCHAAELVELRKYPEWMQFSPLYIWCHLLFINCKDTLRAATMSHIGLLQVLLFPQSKPNPYCYLVKFHITKLIKFKIYPKLKDFVYVCWFSHVFIHCQSCLSQIFIILWTAKLHKKGYCHQFVNECVPWMGTFLNYIVKHLEGSTAQRVKYTNAPHY